MNNDIQIIELTRVEEFTGRIKIVRAINENQAKEYAENWCEENNSLYKEITMDTYGNFFVNVCSDDYK